MSDERRPGMDERRCGIEGCEKSMVGSARGLCAMHAARLRRNGTTAPGPAAQLPLAERFWRRVGRGGESECWTWPANRNNNGYGVLSDGGRPRYAHRVSWEIHFGAIPPGMEVMHACDNPPCTNPQHLQLGTHKANMKDAELKGRLNLRRGTPAGVRHPQAKLTADDVRAIRSLRDQGLSYARIAARFGVQGSTVGAILTGLTWRDVA